jgi:hypothetical protein
MRLAPDLAEKLWTIRDVRELSPDVKGSIIDVIGHEAAASGFSRDGTSNRYGDELDALAAMLLGDAGTYHAEMTVLVTVVAVLGVIVLERLKRG